MKHLLFQKLLRFIQNTVNPLGFEVEELGKSDSGLNFEDGYIHSPEYILDINEEFFWIKIVFNIINMGNC